MNKGSKAWYNHMAKKLDDCTTSMVMERYNRLVWICERSNPRLQQWMKDQYSRIVFPVGTVNANKLTTQDLINSLLKVKNDYTKVIVYMDKESYNKYAEALKSTGKYVPSLAEWGTEVKEAGFLQGRIVIAPQPPKADIDIKAEINNFLSEPLFPIHWINPIKMMYESPPCENFSTIKEGPGLWPQMTSGGNRSVREYIEENIPAEQKTFEGKVYYVPKYKRFVHVKSRDLQWLTLSGLSRFLDDAKTEIVRQEIRIDKFQDLNPIELDETKLHMYSSFMKFKKWEYVEGGAWVVTDPDDRILFTMDEAKELPDAPKGKILNRHWPEL
jgi:hypothetical protein